MAWAMTMRTCIMFSPPQASGMDWDMTVLARNKSSTRHHPGRIILKIYTITCCHRWMDGWMADGWLMGGWWMDVVIDWLIDWRIDWLTNWLNEWMSEWLIDWLIEWLHLYSFTLKFPALIPYSRSVLFQQVLISLCPFTIHNHRLIYYKNSTFTNIFRQMCRSLSHVML